MVLVTCTATKGDMPLEIHWFFNGSPVKSGTSGVVLTNTRRTSQLAIESVSHHNQGNYTCVVKNSAGSINHTADLYVNGTFISSLRFSIIFSLNKLAFPPHSPSTDNAF